MSNQYTKGGVRYQRPRVVDECDINESRGYLDTKGFAEYCITVKQAIDALYKREKRPVSVAEIRRELGEGLIDSQLYDALDANCGTGNITLTSEVSPIRFAPQEIPKKKVLTYAHAPAAPVDRSRPFNGSFKTERKQTY